MSKLWKRFLAIFRLSKTAVCELSNDPAHPERDYHDYPDDEEEAKYQYPMSMFTYHCSRCGKAFNI